MLIMARCATAGTESTLIELNGCWPDSSVRWSAHSVATSCTDTMAMSQVPSGCGTVCRAGSQ